MGRTSVWLSIVLTVVLVSVSCQRATAQIASQFLIDGLEYPVLLTAPPGDTQRLFVVEQRGAIRIIENGQLLPTPFLDIDELVYNVSGSDERGMAGLTFHPDYASNGYFYVAYYNVLNQSVVARYTVSSNPNVAKADSDETILVLDQPLREPVALREGVRHVQGRRHEERKRGDRPKMIHLEGSEAG